ncbi:hypothetical protein SAMN05444920_13255 [Nonomuraea solani]|uniref:Uncharacterized protein n=1 Tax=Nonomuraea solani TaxID=1144553 RepID=A0A1H6F1K4_9ACTN|nr:hypothetical protein SAMN05444920_13255 [Nonomuraea solani]
MPSPYPKAHITIPYPIDGENLRLRESAKEAHDLFHRSSRDVKNILTELTQLSCSSRIDRRLGRESNEGALPWRPVHSPI